MFGTLICRALVLVLVMGGCTRYASVGTDTVGPDYVTGGGEWNTGGGVTAVVRVVERDGATVVCGAWTTDWQSSLTINLNDDVIETGSIYFGKTRLVQNLYFMARVPYSDNISGAQASCVTSSVPWRAEFAGKGLRLRFPRLAYPGDGADEEVGGGGPSLSFRETTRPDIVR